MALTLLLAACNTATPPATDRVDLRLLAVSLASDEVTHGGPMTVKFTIENRGEADAPAFIVAMFATDAAEVETFLGGPAIINLKAGESREMTASRTVPDTLAAGKYTFRLEADPAHVVPQANRADDVVELDLTVSASATSCEDPSMVVSFADAAITAWVEARLKSIGDGTMTCANVSQIRQLNVADAGVTDLGGVQHLTGVYLANLGGNAISDLSPMSGMVGLTDVDLENNRVSDLAPLGSLPELRSLDLRGNDVADLGPLSQVATLEVLVVDANAVTSLEPLVGLPALRFLSAEANQIASADPIAQMTALESIQLSGNAFGGVPSLADLEKLEYLRVGGAGFSGIAGIGDLPNIEELAIVRSEVDSVEAIAGLGTLTRLHLGENHIVDMSPLGALTGLEFLDIDENRLISLNGVQSMVGLDHFSAAGNKITDISPLVANAGLTEGDWVEIQGNCFAVNEQGTLVPPQTDHMRELQVEMGVDVSYLPAGSDEWCGR